MKRICTIVTLSILVLLSTDLQAQNLKRFVTKKSGSESTGDSTSVKRNLNRNLNMGIDRIQSKWLGNDEASSESNQSSTQEPSSQNSTGEYSQEPSGSNNAGGSSNAMSSAFGNAMMGAMGMNSNVNAEEFYVFDAYMEMEIVNHKQDGTIENMFYDTYNSSESLSYAIIFRDKGSMATIIFDTKNKLMLTLSDSDGEKTGFAVAMDEETMQEAIDEAAAESAEDYEEEESDGYQQYKTGKTKSILGYTCHEYKIVDENASEAHMWVTEELKKDVQEEIMENSMFAGWFMHSADMNGMILEYDFVDTDTNERMLMTVTDLKFNEKHSISTKGYTIFSMGEIPEE